VEQLIPVETLRITVRVMRSRLQMRNRKLKEEKKDEIPGIGKARSILLDAEPENALPLRNW